MLQQMFDNRFAHPNWSHQSGKQWKDAWILLVRVCVCVCVENVVTGCNRKFLKRLHYIIWRYAVRLQKPILFFFQWSRCLFAVPQFDHFDHILRQFRWADSLDFTMILPWIFRPTFSSCSQKMNGSLYSPVTRWKEEFKHLIPTSEI